jgi:hypothetical protein
VFKLIRLGRQKVKMSFNLNVEDWGKVGKGLLIAVGGAALTYLGQFVTGSDFGEMTPIVVAGFSVLVNYMRKIGVSTTPKIEE